MMASKKEIRALIKERTRNTPVEVRAKASACICDAVESLNVWKQARNIMLYYPMPNEVDTRTLFKTTGKNFFLPRMIDDENLEIVPYCGEDNMNVANYGIKEPNSQGTTPINQIDLIIVPAVALDIKGYRLGHGKGYYDRLLQNYNSTTVGIVFDFQLFPEIPIDSHDAKLDFVITETKIIKI